MKTFKIIQCAAAGIGLLMSVSLVDSINATGKEVDASIVLLALSGIVLFEVFIHQGRKEVRNESKSYMDKQ